MIVHPKELFKGFTLDGLLTAFASLICTVIMATLCIVVLLWITGRI